MRIAIIGAGISGLLCAYRLSNDFDVTIFEKEDYAGGLCSQVKIGKLIVDKYNHFFSKRDKEMIKVIQKLGLKDKLVWKKVKQASIIAGAFHDMSSPLSLLNLPGINAYDKIKLAFFLAKASMSKDGIELNERAASAWVKSDCTKNVFEHYFKPILKFKFQSYDDVSASYLWARINERKKSEIGVLAGGMQELFNRLTKEVISRGAKIELGKEVNRMDKGLNNKWIVNINGSGIEFDCVVCCMPSNKAMFLLGDELKKVFKLQDVDYLNVGCYILKMKRPLKDKYWLFVNQLLNGYTNIVIDTSALTDNSIVYYPVYRRKNTIEEADKKKIFNACLSALKNINKDFNENWIEEKIFSQDTSVEPVLTNKFLSKLYSCESRVNGLYIPELIYERNLLKTLNTQALKAKIIHKMILKGNIDESGNTG